MTVNLGVIASPALWGVAISRLGRKLRLLRQSAARNDNMTGDCFAQARVFRAAQARIFRAAQARILRAALKLK